MPTDTLPRRELNRIHTWDAIHSTAVDLVMRHGLAGTTVDVIADRANVSRRTFFNYFPAKEDAVLGTSAARLTPEAIAEFEASSEDAFGRAVRLMIAAVGSAFNDLPTFVQRRELLKRHPELRTRIDQHLRDAEQLVQGVLLEKGLVGQDDARALLMLAGTVMRYTFTPDESGLIHNDAAAIDAAIARFRAVMKDAL